MRRMHRLAPLLTAAAVVVTGVASTASAQSVEGGLLSQRAPIGEKGVDAFAGPGDVHGWVKPSQPRQDTSDSVLFIPTPPGGFSNSDLGPPGLDGPQAAQVRGGGERYIDQPIDCNGVGYFSNVSNVNPYVVFEDFVADGSPLQSVEFYGGMYDTNTGGNGNLNRIASIDIEIWSITSGGACGWTYSSQYDYEQFSVASLNPTFECSTQGVYDSYKFTANFATPVALNAGQNFMIIIYARLVDPNDSQLFAWTTSTVANYNAASSWDRLTGDYARCGPDMAFRTNPSSGGTCQPNDCQTTCYFSNYYSNYNPYISLDEFTAATTGDLQRIEVTGGVYDAGSGTGTDFGNISGLYIEVYGAAPDNNFPCGNWITTFLGAHQVSLANTSPRYDCTDVFGISHYKFTVEMPSGFSLAAGQKYMLGVYGIPVDPNSDELFCWAGTDAVYGFTSWSYNLSNSTQEICHDVDQAFCIDADAPCFADFNGDGLVDTRDVLAFLNAWSSGKLNADMDFNLVIDTRDVLAFLNIWTAGC